MHIKYVDTNDSNVFWAHEIGLPSDTKKSVLSRHLHEGVISRPSDILKELPLIFRGYSNLSEVALIQETNDMERKKQQFLINVGRHVT